MAMGIPENAALRDSRRYQLALRLMTHQARTQTITAMTGLSRHQLATLRQRWRIAEGLRHRGPSPTSLERFTHSLRARSEGATLATFCRIYGALPATAFTGSSQRIRLTLDFGERLCLAYEAYRACFPKTDLEIEELLCLVQGIAVNHEVRLGRCASCNGTVLIDRLAPHRSACAHCQSANHTQSIGFYEITHGEMRT